MKLDSPRSSPAMGTELTASLDDLATRVNEEHAACELSVRGAVQHALEAGRLLTEVKAQVGHGNFGTWLAENFEGSERAARSYMQAHRHTLLTGVNRQSIAEKPLSEVLRLLSGKMSLLAGEEAGRQTPLLPHGTYRVIYADPPWKYDDQRQQTTGAAADHYPVVDIDELCDLEDSTGRHVKDLASDGSVLFLWATAPMAPEAFRLLDAWGFTYKAMYVWDKIRGYYGHYNSVCHELLLIGTKGTGCTQEADTLHNSVVRAERSTHSKKPTEFYDIIETMYPSGPYVELFARNDRPGWDSWGLEVWPAADGCGERDKRTLASGESKTGAANAGPNSWHSQRAVA